MKFLKKIASASEAVQTDVNVLYATDTGVKLVKPLPTYTVTFKDYDDSVISTKVYKQGETVTVPSNPTREGYDFTGWSPTVSPTAVADAVYTAQYEENEFKLLVDSFVLDARETEYPLSNTIVPIGTILHAESVSRFTYEGTFYHSEDINPYQYAPTVAEKDKLKGWTSYGLLAEGRAYVGIKNGKLVAINLSFPGSIEVTFIETYNGGSCM